MKSIIECDYVKIWVDDHLPIIFTRLLKVPDSENQMAIIYKLHIKAIGLLEQRKQKIAYSICDASLLTTFPFDLLLQKYLELLPRKIDSVLKIKTIVKPKGRTGQSAKLDELKKGISAVKVNVFEAFEQALSFVANDWITMQQSLR